ncbi:MAG TPA: hypothetical protein VNU66_07990 [Mycobacteriales bacterium]|nr:hypothetical protein [Mycobacteriales bacterium]
MRLPSRARSLLAAEVVLLGVLGALLGLLVAGSVRIPVGPFDADLSLRPALTGSTTVDVPPLGQLQLDTHDGPVQLGVSVASLRPEAARAIVADPDSLRDLGGDVARDVAAEVAQRVGVGDDGPGGLRPQGRDRHPELHGPVVGVELQLAERGDVHGRAAGEGRSQGEVGVEGAHGDADAAGDEQPEQRAEHAEEDDLRGEQAAGSARQAHGSSLPLRGGAQPPQVPPGGLTGHPWGVLWPA